MRPARALERPPCRTGSSALNDATGETMRPHPSTTVPSRVTPVSRLLHGAATVAPCPRRTQGRSCHDVDWAQEGGVRAGVPTACASAGPDPGRLAQRHPAPRALRSGLTDGAGPLAAGVHPSCIVGCRRSRCRRPVDADRRRSGRPRQRARGPARVDPARPGLRCRSDRHARRPRRRHERRLLVALRDGRRSRCVGDGADPRLDRLRRPLSVRRRHGRLRRDGLFLRHAPVGLHEGGHRLAR